MRRRAHKRRSRVRRVSSRRVMSRFKSATCAYCGKKIWYGSSRLAIEPGRGGIVNHACFISNNPYTGGRHIKKIVRGKAYRPSDPMGYRR